MSGRYKKAKPYNHKNNVVKSIGITMSEDGVCLVRSGDFVIIGNQHTYDAFDKAFQEYVKNLNPPAKLWTPTI